MLSHSLHPRQSQSKSRTPASRFKATHLEVTFSPGILILAYDDRRVVAPNHQRVGVPQGSSFEKMLFHGKVDVWTVAVTDDDGCCVVFLGLRLEMRQPALRNKKQAARSVQAGGIEHGGGRCSCCAGHVFS